MGYMKLVVALSMIVTASPVVASQPDPVPEAGAPAASPDARYCLRVEAPTGTRLESVLCRTREEWIELEVDVDKEWAEEGVRVIAPSA